MKRLKRSLSLWLAVALIVSALYVPAFGSETAEGQQEPAVTAAEEAVQEEETVEDQDEDAAAVEEEDQEGASEDQQEDSEVIKDDDESADADDEDAAVDTDQVDENAAVDTDTVEKEEVDANDADEEASADTLEENIDTVLPESVEEGESAEISSGSFNAEANEGSMISITLDANGGYYIDEETGERTSTRISRVESPYWVYFLSELGDPKNDDTSVIFAGWGLEPGGDVMERGFSAKSDLTLYAVWKPAVSVTFDANGGTFSSGKTSYTQQIQKGRRIYGGFTPDIEDDTLGFAGWAFSRDGEPQEYFLIEEEITLYAIWKPYHTVTFHAGEGKIEDHRWDEEHGDMIIYVDTYTERYVEGSSFSGGEYYGITKKEEGKEFAGWSLTEGGEVYDDRITVNDDIDLYAVFVSQYKVTLHSTEGQLKIYHRDPVSGKYNYEYSDTYVETCSEGYSFWYNEEDDYRLEDTDNRRFIGWSTTNGGEPFDGYITITGDIDLYAVWGDLYTITFDSTGGIFSYWEEGSDIKTVADTYTWQYVYGETVNEIDIPDPISQDTPKKVFVGWSTEPDGELLGEEEYVVKGSAVLYALWAEPIVLTLDANGGTITEYYDLDQEKFISDSPVTSWHCSVKSGDVIRRDDNIHNLDIWSIENGDKYFLGWGTTPDGNLIGNKGLEITQAITLYAQWGDPCKVTFDANGGYYDIGEEFDVETDEKDYGVGYILREKENYPDIAKEGLVFRGWSLTRDGAPFGPEGYVVKGGETLYAVWGDETVTARFNAGGGYFQDGDERSTELEKRVEYGSELDGSMQDLLHHDDPGMVFKGWSTEPDGELVEDGYLFDSDITLYAVWNKPLTVTFDANGGIFGDGEQTRTEEVTEGKLIDTYYGDDNRPVYADGSNVFAGWSLTKDGSPIGSEGYVVKGGETLYAVWHKLGWNQIGSGWKYAVVDKDGVYTFYADSWALIGGKWYYFDKDEWMATGWRNVGGEWYFLKANGAMAANEWAKDSTGWCWMDASGKITKNKWIQSGGEWYFLKANGYMAHSEWAQDSGGWYWMGSNGRITRNKWVIIRVNWYFFKADGHMARNEWAKDSGGWYWMDGSGKITKNKWIQSGGKWYYLGANGYMVTGTQRIGGKTYRFNSSGAWIQ